MKLTMELATKDTTIDEQGQEIEKLRLQNQLLTEDLKKTKSSSGERISELESEVLNLKDNIEKGRISKRVALEEQKTEMQKAIDHSTAIIEERNREIENLRAQLLKIKQDQDDEATLLNIFVSKTLGAIELTSKTAQEKGSKGNFVVESQANLGFSNLTIKSTVKISDGSESRSEHRDL